MNDTLSNILYLLVGSALTFAGTWFRILWKERREDKEKARNSLKEIYEAAAAVRDSYHQQTIRYAVVLKDRAQYARALADKPWIDPPNNKLEQLICFDQRQLIPLWESLHTAIIDWINILIEVKKDAASIEDGAPKGNEIKSHYVKMIFSARNIIEQRCTAIQKEAVRLNGKCR